MIDLTIREKIRRGNIQRCREKGIVLPTFEQMSHPATMPESVVKKLRDVGLWEVNPLNLFRITWRNEQIKHGGLFGEVSYLELPSSLTGTPARILALVGKWFPTGAHKVGATYGCLVPALVTGNFDVANQVAVWPSTGNFCRGGAFNSALLGCDSLAILPEEMSRERFEWLSQMAGEVISTPGCESNVKEIFDKCNELSEKRGTDIVVFNQFEEFGNYLWHFAVTAKAIEDMLSRELDDSQNFAAFVSATGSAGTIATGDRLKMTYPHVTVAASEALQCPTLLQNGFGGHRIEGIGDKHVPWIHNVRGTDMVIAVDDNDCIDLLRLFNEPQGKTYLAESGVTDACIELLPLLGISGIGNVLASIKLARYYELTESDVVVTVLTDSMELYQSRIEELREESGALTHSQAAEIYGRTPGGIRTDSMLELSHYDKKRIHNLKYYTWIEQQGRSVDELNAQWHDREYWKRIQEQTKQIDSLIHSFNADVSAGS